MSDFENLSIAHEGGVTTITVDRPKVLNALNEATLLELERAVGALSSDTRVVVLTGAGDKAFVAGADISAMAAFGPQEAEAFSQLGHRVMNAIEEAPVPVIAAVNGFALGGGCELMLACDFAVAADNARIGVPEVTLGVIPGFGGSVRLVSRVGVAWARQLMVTGSPLKADEAARIGLVNEVVPRGELLGHVRFMAEKIAKNAPKAVAYAKRAARVAEQSHPRVAGTFEQELFGMTFATDDQKEGMAAFLEKRSAAWKGR
jgi:enoyl-CoA hydratase